MVEVVVAGIPSAFDVPGGIARAPLRAVEVPACRTSRAWARAVCKKSSSPRLRQTIGGSARLQPECSATLLEGCVCGGRGGGARVRAGESLSTAPAGLQRRRSPEPVAASSSSAPAPPPGIGRRKAPFGDAGDSPSSGDGKGLPPGNPGSEGHPNMCGRPCLHIGAAQCRSGIACMFCHLPHEKPKHRLDLRQREALRTMPVDQARARAPPCSCHRSHAAEPLRLPRWVPLEGRPRGGSLLSVDHGVGVGNMGSSSRAAGPPGRTSGPPCFRLPPPLGGPQSSWPPSVP